MAKTLWILFAMKLRRRCHLLVWQLKKEETLTSCFRPSHMMLYNIKYV